MTERISPVCMLGLVKTKNICIIFSICIVIKLEIKANFVVRVNNHIFELKVVTRDFCPRRWRLEVGRFTLNIVNIGG